jgi:hypothetical protein
MPAVMALQIGANIVSLSAASSKESKNSIAGNTQDTVGTLSEENCC